MQSNIHKLRKQLIDYLVCKLARSTDKDDKLNFDSQNTDEQHLKNIYFVRKHKILPYRLVLLTMIFFSRVFINI